MNRTQIITAVLSRCGRSEGNVYLTGRAQEELDLIQQRLEGGALMPWFLLSDEITSLSTALNTRTVALPANFLREFEDFPLYRYDSTASDPYIRLNKDEFNYLEVRYSGQAATIPVEYCLLGSSFHFFPTPDAVYPLRGMWFEKEAALTSGNLTNAWTDNASDLLLAELGFVIAGSYRRDSELAQMFGAEIERANRRLLAFDEARKQALRDAMLGDRDRP